MSDTLYGIVYEGDEEIHAPFTTLSEARSAYDPASFGTRARIVEVIPTGQPADADWGIVRTFETLRSGPYPLKAIEPEHGGKIHIVTNLGNIYASAWDPTTARHIVAGPKLLDALKAIIARTNDPSPASADLGVDVFEIAQAAIDRWEGQTTPTPAKAPKPEPELGLYDQIQAKRKHDCPDCGAETDTTYNSGTRGNEYFEFCTEENCGWEMVLGTVTESLS